MFYHASPPTACKLKALGATKTETVGYAIWDAEPIGYRMHLWGWIPQVRYQQSRDAPKGFWLVDFGWFELSVAYEISDLRYLQVSLGACSIVQKEGSLRQSKGLLQKVGNEERWILDVYGVTRHLCRNEIVESIG